LSSLIEINNRLSLELIAHVRTESSIKPCVALPSAQGYLMLFAPRQCRVPRRQISVYYSGLLTRLLTGIRKLCAQQKARQVTTPFAIRLNEGLAMNLKEIVTFLIAAGDEPTFRYQRALKLFEFEISLFDGNAFDRLIAGRDHKRLRAARILATIKILEKVDRDLRPGKTSIEKTIAHPEYLSIFDSFLANGGWTQILKTSSVSWFDDKVTEQREEAQTAADIIDFSYRYWKKRPNVKTVGRRVLGGTEAAKYVVEKAYRPAPSDTTIKTRWSKYKCASIFLYLILNQNFKLQPPELSSAEFVDRLLQQTADTAELRRYFCAYQLVRAALSNLNYKSFPALDLDLGSSTPELGALPFSPEMIEAYSDWACNK
jgi:hypothetical protein